MSMRIIGLNLILRDLISETERYSLSKQISELRIHLAAIKCHSYRCAGRKTTATITALLSNALTNNRLSPTGISVYGVINVRYRRASSKTGKA